MGLFKIKDANVFLTIFGEYGDTGEKKLIKSETNMNKFERNQVKMRKKPLNYQIK